MQIYFHQGRTATQWRLPRDQNTRRKLVTYQHDDEEFVLDPFIQIAQNIIHNCPSVVAYVEMYFMKST